MLTETFSYRNLSSAALTGQISSHTLRYGNGLLSIFSYQYDEKGNIVGVSNFGTTTYVYDSQGQLIRENNQGMGRTWTYQYDDAGNIVYKREYTYTTGELGTPVSVSYRQFTDADWGDLMTVYNGTQITYDEIGNPLTDGTWTYTWKQGRQLAGMTSSSSIWSFTYGADGMRTRRSNGIHAYNYVYTGGNLVYMTVDTNALRIGYDLNGTPIGLQYNGVLYFYVTNLQGDVIAILNTSGEPVVNYTYDAWGNILSTTGTMASTLGAHNPLRYRGYVYDVETGLYYLQSRYYNPQWGRFLNADGYAATGQGLTGNNMFAYCNNNPVNCLDHSGNMPVLAIIGLVALGVAAVAIDHHLAKRAPEGVVYQENNYGEIGVERWLYAQGSGFKADTNGIVLCDSEIGITELNTKIGGLDASNVQMLTATAKAELDVTAPVPIVEATAVASLLSTEGEYTIPMFGANITIEWGLHFGAGVGFELDYKEGRFKLTPPKFGLIPSIGVDVDY